MAGSTQHADSAEGSPESEGGVPTSYGALALLHRRTPHPDPKPGAASFALMCVSLSLTLALTLTLTLTLTLDGPDPTQTSRLLQRGCWSLSMARGAPSAAPRRPLPPPASRTRTVGSGRRSTVWRAAHAGGRSLTRLQPCGHDATHEGGETKGDETENDDTSAAESSPHLGP